jgi:hypothetical protein
MTDLPGRARHDIDAERRGRIRADGRPSGLCSRAGQRCGFPREKAFAAAEKAVWTAGNPQIGTRASKS